MTEPQTITVEHLRALLETREPASFLGLLAGEVRVVGATDRDSDDFRSALEVITREDLAERLGDEPTDDELREQADALTTAVRQLGG